LNLIIVASVLGAHGKNEIAYDTTRAFVRCDLLYLLTRKRRRKSITLPRNAI